MCSNAEDVVPAQCIKHLPSTLSQDDAVRLCSDAKSLTPAYCVSSVSKGRVSASDIERCRKETSIPSRLEIRDLDYEGENLAPGVEINVQLHLLDQFGQFRWWDNSTYISARLDLKSSHGATLGGDRVNVTSSGAVEFHGLTVNLEGNFTVKFFVDGGSASEGNPAASLHLRLGQEETEARLAGDCYGLFDSFSCMASDEPGQARRGKFETTSSISFPSSLQYLPCLDLLEEAGFEVLMDGIGNLQLRSAVRVSMMVTGVGLVTKDMNFWERLGVEIGSSKAVIRKAYFKKSLEWHPDRWVQHPHYRSKATQVFELVSEAYRGLLGCVDAEGGC